MWKKIYPYLNDEDFIQEIDTQRLQNQYIKLILLDWDENPIKEIQGYASSGSISLNGNSAVRRTCSLTMTMKDDQDTQIMDTKNIISIGRKVFIEVGIENKTNKYRKQYPIIWYPQGLFVFTQCSLSSSLGQATTLSAQLKDKMCLLNGECGGIITSSIQLDRMDTVDQNGNWITVKPTISQIIREAVNHLGGEQLARILISDIDEKIKSVMRWTGASPVYWITEDNLNILTTNKAKWDGSIGKVFYYGDDIGFIYDDFTYPGELIAQPGDNICNAILDKIKNLLGNYEYYYDVFGNFIFQEIKNYLNTTQATVELDKITNENYIVDMTKGKSVYDFSDSKLAISFSNNPQYTRIKNDYVIWGIRKDMNDIQHSIRYHLAIDNKPQIGNIYNIYLYTDPEDGLQKAAIPMKYSNINNFPTVGVVGLFYEDLSHNDIYQWNVETQTYELSTIGEKVNIRTTDWRTELYLEGVANDPLGLSQHPYYAELAAEWPKLYNLKDKTSIYFGARSWTDSQIANTYIIGYSSTWTNNLHIATQTGDLIFLNVTNTTNNAKYLYILEVTIGSTETTTPTAIIKDIILTDNFTEDNFYIGNFYEDVLKYPWDIDYWLDFIDSQEAISALGVNIIGRRSLSEKKEDYNCVFEPEVPDFILIEAGQPDTAEKRSECIARAQAFIQIDPNIYMNLSGGGMRNSCFERVKTALFDYTNYNNSISIGCLPIYHLEPNTRITVNNKQNSIYGDYMINSISIPLTANGTMNISAVKCSEKL